MTFISTSCATDVGELPDRMLELRRALRDAAVPLRVELGSELGHTMVGRLRQAELDLLAHGPPTARWLLVESPVDGFTADFTPAADELRERGFAIALAHPERVVGDPDARHAAIRHELERGSVLQLNAWSLAGRHGAEARAVARTLVAERQAVVIASDAHGGWRMPALDLGIEQASELIGDAAERLVRSAPRRLLEAGLSARLPVGA